LESRKYQLQNQIIEALKANDNDLYDLLKSQWAHRFGVESLEELKTLDLNQVNQQLSNEDNQKTDQPKDLTFEVDEEIPIKKEDNQKKEITNENKYVIKSDEFKNKESFEIKSYEIADKENHENKAIDPVRDNKSKTKFKALIPLPPQPKYGYLSKWLLRS